MLCPCSSSFQVGYYELKLKNNLEIKHLCVLDYTYNIDGIEVCFRHLFTVTFVWFCVITIQIVLKGLTIITDIKKCTNMYIDYQRRKPEYCRTTSFAGLCITVLPIYSRVIDSLCPSHYRPHAYSQSWLYSNTQQATSAHVSCSEATQISLNTTCFWKIFFFDNF